MCSSLFQEKPQTNLLIKLTLRRKENMTLYVNYAASVKADKKNIVNEMQL